jgi:hypothetical protein
VSSVNCFFGGELSTFSLVFCVAYFLFLVVQPRPVHVAVGCCCWLMIDDVGGLRIED